MNSYKKGLLILVAGLLQGTALAQSTLPKAQVNDYFIQRIKNSPVEAQLMSYDGGRMLSVKNWKASKMEIWEQWKAANAQIEQLPDLVDGHPEMTTHNWDLIGEDPMPFYYFRKGNSSGAAAPLILNLHGSGPKAMEFKNTMAWALRYEDSPSIYFIPQIPNERRYRWWFKPVQYSWERLFRLAMLDTNIDPNKIHITGISEGGYGSQRLGAFYADYLAGVGPMAGGEPLRNAPPINYRYVAFSLQTGEHDHMFGRNTLTKAAKDTFENLAVQFPGDFKHQVIIQPNKGHGIDYTTTTPWLIKHSRNPIPKQLEWVFFPMDGRYRKAFYNVALNSALSLQEGDVQDRVVFNIHYQQNTVLINTCIADAELKGKSRYEGVDFSLFLDDRYIDYGKKVKVIYNGRTAFHKKVKLTEAAVIESCALFGDPERLFPVKISIHK